MWLGGNTLFRKKIVFAFVVLWNAFNNDNLITGDNFIY